MTLKYGYLGLPQGGAKGGVQGDVRFLGFVPYAALRVFYRNAEIFVFPSLYEGFGLPPFTGAKRLFMS